MRVACHADVHSVAEAFKHVAVVVIGNLTANGIVYSGNSVIVAVVRHAYTFTLLTEIVHVAIMRQSHEILAVHVGDCNGNYFVYVVTVGQHYLHAVECFVGACKSYACRTCVQFVCKSKLTVLSKGNGNKVLFHSCRCVACNEVRRLIDVDCIALRYYGSDHLYHRLIFGCSACTSRNIPDGNLSVCRLDFTRCKRTVYFDIVDIDFCQNRRAVTFVCLCRRQIVVETANKRHGQVGFGYKYGLCKRFYSNSKLPCVGITYVIRCSIRKHVFTRLVGDKSIVLYPYLFAVGRNKPCRYVKYAFAVDLGRFCIGN